MTEAATRFITPLTLQTLSGAPVALDLFDPASEAEIGHIRLADEADLLVVAPATADFIARMAAGMAERPAGRGGAGDAGADPAGAGHEREHVDEPADAGRTWRGCWRRTAAAGRVTTVGPDQGPLACGWIGAGRLIEPADIVAEAARPARRRRRPATDMSRARASSSRPGPTREAVDDVRFLGNRSSGKMGAALAAAAAARGAEVTLVAGPGTPDGAHGARRIDVETRGRSRAGAG